jgi:hypothetical protein
MIPFIEATLKKNWREWFPNRPLSNLHYAKIAGNSLLTGHVVILVFAPKVRGPLCVVKFPRTNQYAHLVEQEFLNIQKIKTMWPQANVPSALWFGDMGFTRASIETAVVGQLMGNMRSPWLIDESSAVRRLVGRHFKLAFDWLAELHCHTQANQTRYDRKYLRIKEDSTTSLPQHVDSINWLSTQFSTFFGDRTLPLVCEHGDFWAGNLYIQSDKQIGVIDWGGAMWEQLPLFDAAFFVTSYTLGFSPPNGDSLWMFRQLLSSQSWFAQIAQSSLQQYFFRLAMPEVDLLTLVGLALLRRMQDEEQRPFRNETYVRMFDYWQETVIKNQNASRT